jgi:hypothetical protein
MFWGKPRDLEGFHYFRDIVFSQRERKWAEYLAANPWCVREQVRWKNSFADGVEEKLEELTRRNAAKGIAAGPCAYPQA